MQPIYGCFIDGAWHTDNHGQAFEVIDPATAKPIATVSGADTRVTRFAIESARQGLAQWRTTAAWQRADLLHRIASEMAAIADAAATCITLETGKPLVQSQREWQLSIDQFRWHAEEARRIYGRLVESRVFGAQFQIHHEPVGIVAAFTAWNFPAVLVARKIAPALAAGCAIIVRPSEATPGSASMIVDCARRAGLPAGVVNLVTGDIANTCAPLTESPDIAKITLTGSTAVGRCVMRDAAATLKRLSLELGGNAPCIVFDDADLPRAIELAVQSKFANAGQVCVAPDRFYVHASCHAQFVDGFTQQASALRLGHGLDPASAMGPLIHPRRVQAMQAVVADARDAGATVHCGGQPATESGPGFFFHPTVLSNVPDAALAMREENFGPIAAITTFTDAQELYQRVNDTRYGLAAYVFTRSAARMRQAVSAIQAGMVGVNSFSLAAAEAPFGGIGDSGMGREGGTEGIHDYLAVKTAHLLF